MLGLLLAWWQRSYGAVFKWCGIGFAVLLVWFNIRQSGRKDERADQLIVQNKVVEKAHEVQNDVRRLNDGAVADELRRDWSREQ